MRGFDSRPPSQGWTESVDVLPESTLGANVVANLSGKLWSAAMSFVFVPFVIKYLGIEAYGLIGFYVSLTILCSALDLGLSTTLNRELARLTAQSGWRPAARSLVRTLEYLYWGAGLLVGGTVIVSAPWLARSWINARGLNVDTVREAIVLQGVVLALRWPVPLYSGGLMGLQKQVLVNVLNAAFATAQGAGAVLVLIWISPTIQAFFWCHLLIAAVQSVVFSRCLWRAIRLPDHRPRFSGEWLALTWRFAAGMSGITVGAIVLAQVDKVILSRLLPLTSFGYYTLASLIASGLSFAAMAVYAAVFPVFSRLVANDDGELLKTTYHRVCQILSLMLFPPGIAVAFFARELLGWYVPGAGVAANTAGILSVIVFGQMLSSVLVLPLALQLSYGWTRLAVYKHLLGVAFFVPALLLLVPRYGSVGAAAAWVGLNVAFIICEIPLMHRRVLRHELARWYLVDVGLPFVIALAVLGAARRALPAGRSAAFDLVWLVTSAAVTLAVSGAALPTTRKWLSRLLRYRLAT
jgi:O-antigen/teichoic acid export membrane protein